MISGGLSVFWTRAAGTPLWLYMSTIIRPGYNGWRVLDIDPGTFAAGGMAGSTAYVTGAEHYGDELKQSLADAGNDLINWLEIMMARQYHGTDVAVEESIR